MGSMKREKRIDYITKQLGIKMRVFDPHPDRKEADEYSGEPEDCGIRCICRLTNIDYESVYNILIEYMKKHFLNTMMYKKMLIEAMESSFHLNIYDLYDKKLSLGEFMHTHKKGRYIISIDHHMLTYINGTWYDSEDIFLIADLLIPQRVETVICEMKYAKYL